MQPSARSIKRECACANIAIKFFPAFDTSRRSKPTSSFPQPPHPPARNKTKTRVWVLSTGRAGNHLKMGKNNRHKKFLKSEKAKVKLKAGKKLTKDQNITDTSFKVKKIVIQSQLAQQAESEPVTRKKLNLKVNFVNGGFRR